MSHFKLWNTAHNVIFCFYLIPSCPCSITMWKERPEYVTSCHKGSNKCDAGAPDVARKDAHWSIWLCIQIYSVLMMEHTAYPHEHMCLTYDVDTGVASIQAAIG